MILIAFDKSNLRFLISVSISFCRIELKHIYRKFNIFCRVYYCERLVWHLFASSFFCFNRTTISRVIRSKVITSSNLLNRVSAFQACLMTLKKTNKSKVALTQIRQLLTPYGTEQISVYTLWLDALCKCLISRLLASTPKITKSLQSYWESLDIWKGWYRRYGVMLLNVISIMQKLNALITCLILCDYKFMTYHV